LDKCDDEKEVEINNSIRELLAGAKQLELNFEYIFGAES